MNKKWGTYILLGIGVAFILWLITKDQISAFGGTSNSSKKTPYLVPSPLPADSTVSGIPTSAGTSQSVSEQANIIGEHTNNPVPNGALPSNFSEFPGQWPTIPQVVTR